MSALPRLHVVTDDGILARADFTEHASALLDTLGASVALHLRGPRTDGRRLFDLASTLESVAVTAGALLVVNDRIDVAMAVGLEAVHLGGRSLPAEDARTLLPAAVLGVSCHDQREVEEARDSGATWIFLGNLYETASHPGRPGLGLVRFQELVGGAATVPVIGIGGVTPAHVREVLRAGAWGVAARSAVWDAGSPHGAASEYISVLQAEAGET